MRSTGTSVLFAALGAVCCLGTSFGEENRINETADRLVLHTDDGLNLVLTRTHGAVDAIAVDGHDFPCGGVPLIRFEEVVESPDAPDLLAVGGTARDAPADPASLAADWGVPEDSVVDSVDGEAGPWLEVSGQDTVRPKRTVAISQREAGPLVLSGWCQARVKGEALGWWNRNLALNADVAYAYGRRMPEQSAYFGQYDHGPQFNARVICPDTPIERVEVDLSVPGGDCTAWYRDVRLRPAQYRITHPTSPLERIDACVHQEFTLEKPGLDGLVTLEPTADRIEIRCQFYGTAPLERAVSAYVAIPIDAVGGVWHDHVRGSRRIEEGGIYRDAVWYGAGRDGYNSRYPLACIETADGVGLALGVSVAEPRVHQFEYDAGRRELRIRFDFGLSPDAGQWANRASFTAYLYRYDAADGFRGAADKYHRMFGWAFAKRVEREGLWLAFMTPTAIDRDGWEAFRFQFLESVGHMGWDERQGMYSFRYAEPWIHHHEFPPGVEAEEVHGPIEPGGAITAACRIAARDDHTLPLDMRRRYPAFLGSYIEDKWGEPDGYFFRHPGNGRNENMMIVNPNDRLLPSLPVHVASQYPDLAQPLYSCGAWDREIIREAMGVDRQWHVDGWTVARVSARPCIAIDVSSKSEGRQSVRLDPIEAKSYFEQYLRGLNQVFYCEGASSGRYTFSYSARGENVPIDGTRFRWTITFWFEDGTAAGHTVPFEELSEDWQERTVEVECERSPAAIRVSLRTPTWEADPTLLWVDDVRLAGPDSTAVLLRNGGFEDAGLLPCRLDGVYLDTMECYECDFNYRRAHWAFAEEPLTFDCARAPTMHQVFSHVTFARHVAEWLRPKGMFVFGNCAPRTPFAAPHLDVLGGEQHWKHGGDWTPWPDAEFNFARFMCRAKPFCILQYSDLDAEEQARYVKRCLFYGVFPSNQAAPSGGWYWADPIVVKRHRDVFARFVPVLIEVAQAGWQALTLAEADTEGLWLERFGEGGTTYLTAFNPSDAHLDAEVALDPRLGFTGQDAAFDVLHERILPWTEQGGRPAFEVGLDAEDVGVYRITRTTGEPAAAAP